MRAIIITRPGDPDVLQPGDVATPDPGADQIRVAVHAAGVNRADVMQRRGHYPAPPDVVLRDVPGLEYAGIVDAVGADVTRWQAGDRVMGLVGGGAYAEYVVVHEDEALPVPSRLSLEEAAAIPEAFLTAYDALQARVNARAGESVLIHAVTSGVGTAASQLAKRTGCFVIGTSRTAEKLERATAYGVDVTVDVTREDFVDVTHAATDGRGVDIVLDLVGGDYLSLNLKALAPLGRIALIGLVAGATAPLEMRTVLNKRATLVGTVMRARSLGEKIEVARAFQRDVLEAFESGALRPVIDATFSFDDAAEAHRIVEANRNFGKLVLKR